MKKKWIFLANSRKVGLKKKDVGWGEGVTENECHALAKTPRRLNRDGKKGGGRRARRGQGRTRGGGALVDGVLSRQSGDRQVVEKEMQGNSW